MALVDVDLVKTTWETILGWAVSVKATMDLLLYRHFLAGHNRVYIHNLTVVTNLLVCGGRATMKMRTGNASNRG